MMLLRSRIVLPITAPPIEDGAVLISGNRLAAVGRWSDLRPHTTGLPLDLGERVVLPGLINAHCHLDYTHFAGQLPPPRRFTDWIHGVLGLKAQWSFSEYAASWLDGARQLLASGCTTVLDIEAVPELLPDVWTTAPLRVLSALELTGVRARRDPDAILRDALAVLDRLHHPRHTAALAPHAPYSTRPELLHRISTTAQERDLLVTMHVAESEDEFLMFRHGTGPMHDWLRNQRDLSDCGFRSPVRHVAASGLLHPRCVLAHVNHLDDGDAECLASGAVSVAHCPRSHCYFQHAPFPADRLRQAGVPICLGTDSLLSVRKGGRPEVRLDFLDELATATHTLPGLSPHTLLHLATAAGAQALGRAADLGQLRAGHLADLIVVPFNGPPEHAAEGVVHHAGPVAGSMIDGRWTLDPTLPTPAGNPGP